MRISDWSSDVCSSDLDAASVAPTMQAALDNWAEAGPRLIALAEDLNHDAIPKERFHERDAASPLPRAYQWADGSAYVNHVALEIGRASCRERVCQYV